MAWTPDFGTLDAAAPTWAPKRPIRIALLGDFGGGAASGRLDTGAELGGRKPISVEFDNLEDQLGRLMPSLTVPLGESRGAVELSLNELDGFHPDTLFRELDLFRKLADLRKRLNNTATFDKAAAEVNKLAGGAKRKASRVGRGRARGATPDPGARLSDFARLTGRAPASSELSVEALLRDMVSPFVVPADKPEKTKLLATLDAAIADSMRALLHQPDLQAAESLWRGVDFLLRRLETGPMLQVHLIDVSAEEWAADLACDDLADSGLYQLLVRKPGEAKDGGYTYIAGLYQLEAAPPQLELLGRMAKIAAAAGAPFLTGFDTDAFADAKRPPHELISDALAALRQLPEARRLMLLGPRFLLRHPYGRHSDPISSFDFEEFTAQEGLAGMLWGHPALLALTALAGQGGQLVVGDLPFHHFRDADGDSTALPCTERLVSADFAARLARLGITALQAHRGEASVRVAGLFAVNGEPLGAAAGAKPAARIGVQIGGGRPDAAASAKAAPSARRGDDDDDSPVPSDDAEGDDSSSEDSGGSDDLDALLASLGGDDSDSSASSEGGSADDAGMDDDLDALLKSLG
jgi:type VI secretion system protein ImpC